MNRINKVDKKKKKKKKKKDIIYKVKMGRDEDGIKSRIFALK